MRIHTVFILCTELAAVPLAPAVHVHISPVVLSLRRAKAVCDETKSHRYHRCRHLRRLGGKLILKKKKKKKKRVVL